MNQLNEMKKLLAIMEAARKIPTKAKPTKKPAGPKPLVFTYATGYNGLSFDEEGLTPEQVDAIIVAVTDTLARKCNRDGEYRGTPEYATKVISKAVKAVLGDIPFTVEFDGFSS